MLEVLHFGDKTYLAGQLGDWYLIFPLDPVYTSPHKDREVKSFFGGDYYSFMVVLSICSSCCSINHLNSQTSQQAHQMWAAPQRLLASWSRFENFWMEDHRCISLWRAEEQWRCRASGPRFHAICSQQVFQEFAAGFFLEAGRMRSQWKWLLQKQRCLPCLTMFAAKSPQRLGNHGTSFVAQHPRSE